MKHRDKVLHFLVGMAIGLLAFLSTHIALVAVVLAGIGKEVYDGWKNRKYPHAHTVDGWDAVATIVGGILVTLFFI